MDVMDLNIHKNKHMLTENISSTKIFLREKYVQKSIIY